MSSYIATKYKGEIKRKFQLKLIKLTFGCKQHLIWLTKLHSFKDWLIVMQGWNVSCDVVQCNKDSCRLYKAFWPAEQNIKHRRVHIQKYSFQLIFAGCLNMKISQFKEICSRHFQCRQLHYGFCHRSLEVIESKCWFHAQKWEIEGLELVVVLFDPNLGHNLYLSDQTGNYSR